MSDKLSAVYSRTGRPRPARLLVIPLVVAAALAVIAVTAILTNGSTTGLNPLGAHFVATLVPGAADTPDTPIAIVNTTTGSKTGFVNSYSHDVAFESAATGDGVHYVTSLDWNNACRSRLYRFTLSSAGTPSPLTARHSRGRRTRDQQIPGRDGRPQNGKGHPAGADVLDLRHVHLVTATAGARGCPGHRQ